MPIVKKSPAAAPPLRPVWRGPHVEGVTFSLLSRFLVCRERFRVYVVEGLASADAWNPAIGFGSMWHVLEEQSVREAGVGGWSCGTGCATAALASFTDSLYRQYPFNREDIAHWVEVAKITFPRYLRYWQEHPDTTQSQPVFREEVFRVEYPLPGRRPVILRGKWDGVDLLPGAEGSPGKLVLLEHKTKGTIDEEAIAQQLNWDLQTLLYLTALGLHQAKLGQYRLGGEGLPRSAPITGVRYNVVRRPLASGRGSIVQKKPSKANPLGESKAGFYTRLAEVIDADPASYFMRWDVAVSFDDITRFNDRCLRPLLTAICDWWDWVSSPEGLANPFAVGEHSPGVHWQHPFGVYNPLQQGRGTDLDNYLATGSKVGLAPVAGFYPELEG